MLQRFVPWGSREIPLASLEADRQREGAAGGAPAGSGGPVTAGIAGFLGGTLAAALINALIAALKNARGGKPFELAGQLQALLHPATTSQVIDTVASLLFGVVLGLGAAAYVAARRATQAA
jgi:hypothetical protein